MALYQSGETISMTAGTSLAALQNYVVAHNGTAGEVALPSAAGVMPVGVLLNKPGANQAASIQTTGMAKVVSNGAVINIAVGGTVFASTDGKVYQKGIGTATVAWLGIAQEASAADGTIIQVLLRPSSPL